METIKITKIFRTSKSKDGKPLIGSNDKPYTRVAVQAQAYGSRWISGFESKANSFWAEGDEVEVNIIESTAKDKTGQPYLNFSMPNVWDEIKEIKKRLDWLEESVVTPKSEKAEAKPEETMPEGLDF